MNAEKRKTSIEDEYSSQVRALLAVLAVLSKLGFDLDDTHVTCDSDGTVGVQLLTQGQEFNMAVFSADLHNESPQLYCDQLYELMRCATDEEIGRIVCRSEALARVDELVDTLRAWGITCPRLAN